MGAIAFGWIHISLELFVRHKNKTIQLQRNGGREVKLPKLLSCTEDYCCQ